MLMTLERLAKYNLKIKGVYHIGAHTLEESNMYFNLGTNNILWFEANKDLCDEYYAKLVGYTENMKPKLFNLLLSNTDNKEIEFHIMNHRECSSTLKMKTHLINTPYVKIDKTIMMKTIRMDTFIQNNNIDISKYNFINTDVQGTELDVIKGFGDVLSTIDYIYTEVNIAELYEGCCQMSEIDEYLKPYGFNRVETEMTPMEWGDAFYIKENK